MQAAEAALEIVSERASVVSGAMLKVRGGDSVGASGMRSYWTMTFYAALFGNFWQRTSLFHVNRFPATLSPNFAGFSSSHRCFPSA
jgi:hypothetical protein